MSKLYTADGKRRSSRVHATRSWDCPCGRTVWGNGGKSAHQRACRTWLEYWLASVNEMLARTGDNALPAELRPRWEAYRDETRFRLAALKS
jgi:hypothetical protein